MSLLFSDTLSRESAETRSSPNALPSFNRYQTPMMICRRCQQSFAKFKGMKKMPGSSIGYCKEYPNCAKPEN